MRPPGTRPFAALGVLAGICACLAAGPGHAADGRISDVQARALAGRVAALGRARRDPWLMLAAADILAAHEDAASDAEFASAISDARRFAGWDTGPVNEAIARLDHAHENATPAR